MRTTLAALLVCTLVCPGAVFAADGTAPLRKPEAAGVSHPVSAGLRAAVARETTRVAIRLSTGSTAKAQAPQPEHRSWISRHPALFGLLVGAGAGAVASMTMENELFCSGGDEDCLFHGGGRVLVGAGIGAGAGAAIGALVGVGRK